MNDLPPWRVVEWPELDSTNAAAHRWLNKPVENSASNGHRLVFTTPHQTAGRGQQSRPWHGQKGMDLAMSVVLTDSLPSACPFALNLAVSLAVLEGVEKAMPKLEGVPWEIKWPNDLLAQGRKLAGLLPGVVQRGSQLRLLRIGLGLNVRNPVPSEGIALRRLEGQQAADPTRWTAEILLALDHCHAVGGDGAWCIDGVQARLWSDQLVHPQDGQIWHVNGLEKDGALRLRQGSRTESWRRWP